VPSSAIATELSLDTCWKWFQRLQFLEILFAIEFSERSEATDARNIFGGESAHVTAMLDCDEATPRCLCIAQLERKVAQPQKSKCEICILCGWFQLSACGSRRPLRRFRPLRVDGRGHPPFNSTIRRVPHLAGQDRVPQFGTVLFLP
jgi:hypothetical protein